MAKGGRQPGAGRPKGSTTKPQFRDYFTEADIKVLVEAVKDQAIQDNRLLMWALDQWFGKAPQAIVGPEGGPVEITVVKYAK